MFTTNPWKTFAFITVAQFSTIILLSYLILTETWKYENERIYKNTAVNGRDRESDEGKLVTIRHCQLSTERGSCVSKQVQDPISSGSSVVCYGSTKKNRTCKFNNLCYNSKWDSYMFFHGPKTNVSGLPKNRFDPALLDLTSVDDHNTKYFNFIDFSGSEIDGMNLEEMRYVRPPSILFHRFNPENLMHVFHDDILPLWMTMRIFISGLDQSVTNLIMMDGRDTGPWFNAYKTLSKNILLKKNLTKYKYVCFNEVIIGLLKDTTWYQYGFKVPQGPIPNSNANGVHLRFFADEFTSMCKSKGSGEQYVVLVVRKHTRLILNQIELSIELANIFHKEVFFLDLDYLSLEEAVCAVQNAVTLVGMHGAELILSLFMSPRTALVEMYPFGIQPENYTPYKTLSALIGLQYVAWKNVIQENSKAHPERIPQEGGISHLPISLQKEIKLSNQVPQHLCCDNPFWLYRIFQDTFVDIKSLRKIIESLNFEDEPKIKQEAIMYPDKVKDVSCNLALTTNSSVILSATWVPPVNARYFKNSLKYQVIVQKNTDENVIAYEVNATRIILKNVEGNGLYNIWVRCKVNESFGPLSGTNVCVGKE